MQPDLIIQQTNNVLEVNTEVNELDVAAPGPQGPGYNNSIISLTDAPIILVNASLANQFRVTLGGNRTLANPTNLYDGQKLLFIIVQDGTGSRTLSFDTKYTFSATLPAPTLTTTPGKRDFLGFIYDKIADLLYFLAYQPDY